MAATIDDLDVVDLSDLGNGGEDNQQNGGEQTTPPDWTSEPDPDNGGEGSDDGDVITDGAFIGDGCAISQASADIILGMVIGKNKDEALAMGEIFMKMIKGEATDEEIDSLEEASALRDIGHMPARVKCAVLGWRTLTEAMGGRE